MGQPHQHIERASKLLPAWFVPRMMDDDWSFAFLMSTGDIIHLLCIEDVHRDTDGGLWLDVSRSTYAPAQIRTKLQGRQITVGPIGRAQASMPGVS